MYSTNGLTNFTKVLKEVLVRLTEHAIAHKLLSVGQNLVLEDVRVFSWPQVWGDCSCGFGGLAGQAITVAQTVVAICNLSGAAAVYHDGRYAYLVERPTDSFLEAFSKQRLPGQAEFLRNRLKWDAAEKGLL